MHELDVELFAHLYVAHLLLVLLEFDSDQRVDVVELKVAKKGVSDWLASEREKESSGLGLRPPTSKLLPK